MKVKLKRRLAMGVAVVAVGYSGARAVRLVAAVRAAERTGPGARHRPPALTINRPPTEVYAFWRDLPNLARMVGHVTRVDEIDDRRSRWVVAGIGADEVEFVVEIVRDDPPRLIAWRVGDELLTHEGMVEFRPAPGDRGTEVRSRVTYPADSTATRHRGRVDELLYGALRRAKQAMEGGEIIVVDRHDLAARVPAATGGRA